MCLLSAFLLVICATRAASSPESHGERGRGREREKQSPLIWSEDLQGTCLRLSFSQLSGSLIGFWLAFAEVRQMRVQWLCR